ncbi:MAG TPA: glycosyltransferase family 1 protein, partial [Chromatiales bacterium]|nr:glycosyltransferase family 1 protein [Chromatiales bacterium]
RRGALYDATDVLTVPRLRREASDRNTAEAMVRGAAVIATRIGATHEWIRDGKTGLLIPPGDAGALAGALARLLADEAWRTELVMAGRWLIGNQFTTHEHVETLAAVIAACRVQRRGPTRWHLHPRPPEPPAGCAARAS